MVIVRGIIAFITLLIFARVLGKQQIGQLTPYDYLLGITIGSIAATLTVEIETSAWTNWVGLFVWVVLAIVSKLVSLKWRYLSKYMTGEPTVVIMNGHIMEEALGKMRYRLSDILEQLRNKGVFNLSEVEFAVLETNGQLSVQLKSQYQPVKPYDLNISTNYEGLSTELIYDGVVIDQNLKQVKLDRKWLDSELKKQGISDYSEVFLALLDTQGNLYVDKYTDKVKSITDISDYKGPY